MGIQLAVEVAAASGTIGALLLAVWQLRQNSRLASQTAASQVWMEYVRLGLENPDLGETRTALRYLKVKNVHDLLSGNSLESQRYLWFLTVMLDACETLVRTYGHEAHWIKTVEYNLGLHREALVEFWPDERGSYSIQFGRFVEAALLSLPHAATGGSS